MGRKFLQKLTYLAIVFSDRKNIMPENNLILQKLKFIKFIYFCYNYSSIKSIWTLLFTFKFDPTVCAFAESTTIFLTNTFTWVCFSNFDSINVLFYGYLMSNQALYQVSICIFYLKALVCILNSDSRIYFFAA